MVIRFVGKASALGLVSFQEEKEILGVRTHRYKAMCENTMRTLPLASLREGLREKHICTSADTCILDF